MSKKVQELVDDIVAANNSYRMGEPTMTDLEYDDLLHDLSTMSPNHELLHTVEYEPDFGEGKVRHTHAMLSTDKAYDVNDIKKWVGRVVSAAKSADVNVSDIVFKATPKLDGMAGKYLNNKLVTRGDGLIGNDVTSALEKGVVPINGENTGVGEIVMSRNYFNEHLKGDYSHPRNVVVGAVSANTLKDHVVKALVAKSIVFMPYTALECWRGNALELIKNLDDICKSVEKCGYPVDGTVIEIEHAGLKNYMGSGSHHHNWQIAKKRRGESKECEVLGITWQVGRTGRVTPVINIEPTEISGAMISNVTGHHAGNIIEKGVGAGGVIEVIRSGEVIPFLAKVITKAEANIPKECPCCGHELEMEKDFLVCNGSDCQAQIESKLIHWFNILGNVDGFGPGAIKKIVDGGINSIASIYNTQSFQFVNMGFGPGQAANLVSELKRSRTDAINDWRFLAAFGIHHLGRGDSKKILKHVSTHDLYLVTEDFLFNIEGFGGLTSKSISQDIKARYDEINVMLEMGFNLIDTMNDDVPSSTAITGEFIVFTGGMVMGTRDTMKESAEAGGATPQSSINKKTTILVIGNKASPSKIAKAKGLGAKVISEFDYYTLIGEVA
jgi:DNA ligase (NAD+)